MPDPKDIPMDERIVKLLDMIGNRAKCKGCGDEIWWVKSKNGRPMPISHDFVCHFTDCSGADKFRRKSKSIEEVDKDDIMENLPF